MLKYPHTVDSRPIYPKESNLCTDLDGSIIIPMMIQQSGAIQELIYNNTCLKFSTLENESLTINSLDDSRTHYSRIKIIINFINFNKSSTKICSRINTMCQPTIGFSSYTSNTNTTLSLNPTKRKKKASIGLFFFS